MTNQTNCNHRTPPKYKVDYIDDKMVIVNGVSYSRTQPTPIVIREDENTIVVGGVKYQKVSEKPKFKTLYYELGENYSHNMPIISNSTFKDNICTIVSNWLPKELQNKSFDSYTDGWNSCLRHIRMLLR